VHAEGAASFVGGGLDAVRATAEGVAGVEDQQEVAGAVRFTDQVGEFGRVAAGEGEDLVDVHADDVLAVELAAVGVLPLGQLRLGHLQVRTRMGPPR
jgi:hypothetical protein